MTQNISGLAFKSNSIILDFNQKNYTAGETLEAEVIRKNEQLTIIKIDQLEVKLPKDVQIQENTGEKAEFFVEKATEGKMVLKYQPKKMVVISKDGALKDGKISENTKSSAYQIETAIKDISDGNTLKVESLKDQMIEIDVADEGKFLQMAQELKGDIEKIIASTTDEDIKAIVKDHYNIDKITINMFKALVDQNKIALKLSDDLTIQNAIEEKVVEFENEFRQKFADRETLKTIVEGLKAEQVPITLKNVEKIQGVIEQYKQLQQLPEGQILNVLRNQKSFTIDEVTKAIFLPIQEIRISPEIENLDAQIRKILQNKGIEVNEDTVLLAKKAISSEIPLDDAALIKIKTLTEDQESIETNWGRTSKTLATLASRNIQSKMSPAQIELPLKTLIYRNDQVEQVNKLVDYAHGVTDEQIIEVIEDKQVVNIHNLIEAIPEENAISQNIKFSNISETVNQVISGNGAFELSETVELTLNKLNINAKAIVQETEELQFIKAKICVEELRLKMTYESANRLAEKGIDIAIEPIEEVIEHLKVLETEQYKSALKVHQVATTESNLQQMEVTMTAVSRLESISSFRRVQVMSGEIDFTLEAITREQNISVTVQKALGSYGQMETEVRPDLGDNLSKTFDQIGPILEELDMEIDDENIRLVKALAMSEREITIENIEALKLIDQKISLLTDKIRPTIVASMIKDQLNPIKLNVDEMLEYLRGYEDAFLDTDSERLAESVFEVKNSDLLTADEKESLIGIYRMLRTIAKSKGTAASFLVKKNLPLSMNNLFEAAKYLKHTGGKNVKISADIDDSFGLLDRLDYSKSTISEQIKKAIEDLDISPTKTNAELLEALQGDELSLDQTNFNKSANNHIGLERFFQGFSHEKMMALEREGLLADADKPLEELTEAMSKMDTGDKVSTKEILSSFSEMVKMDIQTLKIFEKYGFKATTNQLLTHYMMKEESNLMSQTFNRLFNQLGEDGGQTNRLQGHMERLSNEVLGTKYTEILEDIKQELTRLQEESTQQGFGQSGQGTKGFSNANQLIEYQQQLFQEEDYYQIPIMMDGQWSQLNVYYQNHSAGQTSKAEDEMDIYLFFETKNMGKVQSHMHLNDRHMQFSIYGEMDEDKELLSSYQDQIMGIVGSRSFQVEGISFEYFDAKSPVEEEILQDEDAIRYIDSKFIARA